MKNIKALLEQAAIQLSPLSKTPRLDAELLLCCVLKKDRTYLFSHPERVLSELENQHWQDLLVKRLLQIPIAYLVGEKSFWNLDLQVNEHTLIPRPETELLVEIILEKYSQDKHIELLDLGTGSGAIALALACERLEWKISAVDFSAEALKIAILNAEKNNIHTVKFFQSDWFSVFSKNNYWDVIVSNPPYLDEYDSHLITEEIRYEPRSALVAKKNGLDDIEKIIIEARQHLKLEGRLLIEHGCNQGESVRELFLINGYSVIETITDFAGLDRVSSGVYLK